MLSDQPELLSPSVDGNGNGALALLQQQATVMGVSTVSGAGVVPTAGAVAALDVAEGQEAVACPMAGSVLEFRAREGEDVKAGDAMIVISAMKMESQVAAPCDGRVAAVQGLSAGDSVEAGQVFAVIEPSAGAQRIQSDTGDGTWAPLLKDVATMHSLSRERLAPGSDDPGVVRQRSRGKLTCRESSARRGHVPRGRQCRRVRVLRRGRQHHRVHTRQPRRRLGQDRGSFGGGLR